MDDIGKYIKGRWRRGKKLIRTDIERHCRLADVEIAIGVA